MSKKSAGEVTHDLNRKKQAAKPPGIATFYADTKGGHAFSVSGVYLSLGRSSPECLFIGVSSGKHSRAGLELTHCIGTLCAARRFAMYSHCSRTPILVCLVAWGIAVPSMALADEPSQSLYEKRLSIMRGTAPGIVIFDFQKSPTPAVAASAPGVSEPEPKKVAESAPPAAPTTAPVTALLPPTGRSMNTARRLGSGDQGIVVPTAKTTSPLSADPVAKP